MTDAIPPSLQALVAAQAGWLEKLTAAAKTTRGADAAEADAMLRAASASRLAALTAARAAALDRFDALIKAERDGAAPSAEPPGRSTAAAGSARARK